MLTERNKDPRLKEQRLHSPFLPLTTSAIRRPTGHGIGGRLCGALRNIPAQGRGLADGRARAGAAPQMMAVFFVGSGSSERKEGADKEQLLAVAVRFVWTGAAQQLQEAFIMSLVKGGKSQYSENKNGFETGGGLPIMYNTGKHNWDVRLAAPRRLCRLPCLRLWPLTLS